jgi:hypothetical protein
VSDRKHITLSRAVKRPKGDVCPEPTTIGIELQRLGRNASAVMATFGGPSGRQAFAVGREVPT